MEINRETCEYQRQTNATFTDVDCDIYLKLRILQPSNEIFVYKSIRFYYHIW